MQIHNRTLLDELKEIDEIFFNPYFTEIYPYLEIRTYLNSGYFLEEMFHSFDFKDLNWEASDFYFEADEDHRYRTTYYGESPEDYFYINMKRKTREDLKALSHVIEGHIKRCSYFDARHFEIYENKLTNTNTNIA